MREFTTFCTLVCCLEDLGCTGNPSWGWSRNGTKKQQYRRPPYHSLITVLSISLGSSQTTISPLQGFTPSPGRQPGGSSPSPVSPAPGQVVSGGIIRWSLVCQVTKGEVVTWLRASICSRCLLSSVMVTGWSPSRSAGRVSQLIPPTKGDLLVTGGAAWDSASIRRIESAFFSRVRRSSGDRSSVCSGTYLSGMLIFSGSHGWNSPLYVLRTISGASRGFSMRSMSMSSLARARPSCRAKASCTAG